MSEPQYMQGDSIARSFSELANHEHTCECGSDNSVEVEEQFHANDGTVSYWGSYTCPKCNKNNDIEGWYWV